MQKERPILYSTPMVQAKLAGRKTNTRRMSGLHEINSDPGRWDFIRFWNGHAKFCEVHNHTNEKYVKCPYGQPGDLLWGRESWCSGLFSEGDVPGLYHYKASHKFDLTGLWRPSIHMPKEAARIWDEITGIRVERVADISEADCIAEGIEYDPDDGTDGIFPWKDYTDNTFSLMTARQSFRSLWQSINGTPRSIQSRQNGKLVTTGYEVYPFDEWAAAEFQGLTTWRGKPLTVITNPLVWVIETKQLSVTGRPVNT